LLVAGKCGALLDHETRPLKPNGGLHPRAHALRPVNTVYVMAVMTSLNCGVDVLCPRAVEPDLRYYTQDACTAALNRLIAPVECRPDVIPWTPAIATQVSSLAIATER
jgi:hypothetical protein